MNGFERKAYLWWARSFVFGGHDPCWCPCNSTAIFPRLKVLTVEIHGHWRGSEKASIIKRRHVYHTTQLITMTPGSRDPDTAAVANMEIGDVQAEAIGLRRVCRKIDAYASIRIGNRHRAMTLAKPAAIFSRHEAVRISVCGEFQLQATTVATTFEGSHCCKST